jgi:hypothetical protein
MQNGLSGFYEYVFRSIGLPKAESEKLFAISTAIITLESSLGLKTIWVCRDLF